MENTATPTFFNDQDILEVNLSLIKKLKEAASNDLSKRARFNLHKSHQDKVHEMIVVLHKDTYVRPHQHSNKTESFHLIEGSLVVIFFDDDGKIINQIKMSEPENKYPFIYRLSRDFWHMVIPLSEFVVFHETTNGPFIKGETKFPDWAPDDKDTYEVEVFKQRIKNEVLGDS